MSTCPHKREREREILNAPKWGGPLPSIFDFGGWGLSPSSHARAPLSCVLSMHACIHALNAFYSFDWPKCHGLDVFHVFNYAHAYSVCHPYMELEPCSMVLETLPKTIQFSFSSYSYPSHKKKVTIYIMLKQNSH